MNLFCIQHKPPSPPVSLAKIMSPHFLYPSISPFSHESTSRVSPNRPFPSACFSVPPISVSRPGLQFRRVRISQLETQASSDEDERNLDASPELEEDLVPEGAVYQETLRLVECSMFAAVAGLSYFLSNSLAIEKYLGFFFALPIVVSSMRWGVAAGRKTMVATAILLLVLSGPVKALTYLLMHGLLGFTMGTLWRMGSSWGLSILLCALVRALGAMGYVLISSFLIRENILALITINIHASLTYIITALGVNTVPSMDMIYAIFGTLLMLNCGFFVFLLHILYAVFFIRMGMRPSLTLPRWLERAL
ncbi:hypothetical protein NMG60_11036114 [Bertholletia excelsa]